MAVWPAPIDAISVPEAAANTFAVLSGEAQVTMSFVESGLSTRPVGSAGTAIRRMTLPPGNSTHATS